MEAKLKQHGEIAIVSIKGFLDIEKTQPFRDACVKHFLGEKVIFNLEKANFVGSTGIQSFIEAMRIVSQKTQTGIRLVGLKAEFKRIFTNLEIQGLEFCDNETLAIHSFSKIPDVIP
jgi:anti-anti-sigma factor